MLRILLSRSLRLFPLLSRTKVLRVPENPHLTYPLTRRPSPSSLSLLLSSFSVNFISTGRVKKDTVRFIDKGWGRCVNNKERVCRNYVCHFDIIFTRKHECSFNIPGRFLVKTKEIRRLGKSPGLMVVSSFLFSIYGSRFRFVFPSF